MNDYIIAVDQSTSATKALLFDRDAQPVYRVDIAHRQIYPKPGWVEHDPVEIVENTREAIARLVAESAVDPKRVAALALTNQRETIVAWDGVTGKPLYNALVWQDERGTPYCERALAEAGSVISEKTGLVVDTYFSASKLAWLVETSKEARQALSDGRFYCGTIDSWLVWNLTKRTVFACDMSNASRTLLFDIHRLAWDEDLLALFGLRGAKLPEPRPSDAVFGRYDIAPGISVPITGVMGDSHASLFGQGGVEPGRAKTTYGTGSSVMMNIGERAIAAPTGIVLSVGWNLSGKTSYVFEGNIHFTGDTVKWMRDNIGLFVDYAEAERLVDAVDSTDGVYLVPAFSGLGSPHWIHGVRAALLGMSRGTSRAHLVRAAIESIAFQVHDVVDAMRRTPQLADGKAVSLSIDGGASSNRFLMQFQADILQVPVRNAPITEVSARGVAFAAGLTVGLYGGIAELDARAKGGAEYRPSMDLDRRNELLAGWHRAVKAVLSMKS